MPINNPNDVSGVRAPRLQILSQGTPIRSVLSFEVNNNSYLQADTFTARFALYADPNFGPDWWAAQPIPLMLDIQASLDSGQNWTSLIVGQVDRATPRFAEGVIEVDGRDLTANFIDYKTDQSFQNRTSSEIVEELAVKHGMQADVTSTSTLVGRYYELDHERVGTGEFVRTTTEWNLLCSLASHEGFDIWVTGTTVHFHPKTQPGANPYVIVWDHANDWSNAVELTVQRSLTMAKDVAVMVRSWNSATGRAITRTSGNAQGNPKVVHLIRPNLSEQDAQDLANRIRAEMTEHERTVEFTRPADLTLGPRDHIQLRGTNSSWDTDYFIASVSRTLGFDDGFAMRVRAKTLSPEAAAAGQG